MLLVENKKVLVIEDSRAAAELIKLSLSTIKKLETTVAKTIKEARDKIKTEHFDLVTVDNTLPDGTGLSILEELSSKNIPVFLISASYDDKTIEKAYELGVKEFFRKPFNNVELINKTNFWLEFFDNKKVIAVKSNELLQIRNVIKQSMIISKTNTQGIIIDVNEKFCEISGYSKEELIGKPHNIVRHPDTPKEVFRELWETIKSKKMWSGIVKNRRKDGEPYWVKAYVFPMLDINGEIVEFISVRDDITAIKEEEERAEQLLGIVSEKLQETKFSAREYEKAILDSWAVIRTDPENIIEFANDKFIELSGYTNEELIGKKCTFFRSKKHISNGDCEDIKWKLKSGFTVKKQFENVKKDGSYFYTDTTIVPLLNADMNIFANLHLMYDVTELVKLHTELEETQKELIYKMGEIGESRNKETGYHVKRVAEYSRLLAQLAGLEKREVELVFIASPMHDIGKVAIPDHILLKPGKLTPEEFEVMKTHAEIGGMVLSGSEREIIKAASIIAGEHHEKWDGSGYPKGKKGEEIHIFARITAIADVFDALGSDRPYKKSWELDKIIELFKQESGRHFDPYLTDLFLNNLEEFLKIRDKYKD